MKPCILALKNTNFKGHFRITELIFNKVYKRIKVKIGRLLFELGSFKYLLSGVQYLFQSDLWSTVLVSVRFVDIYSSCERPRLWH